MNIIIDLFLADVLVKQQNAALFHSWFSTIIKKRVQM